LCTFSLKKQKPFANLFKGQAEAWKILGYQQSPSFFQELEPTTLTEYFRPINLTFVVIN